MKALLLAAVSVSILVGCGGGSTGAADGGRDRIVCTEEYVTMTVLVQEADGGVAKGAVVTAKNVASGKTITGTTNDNGATGAIGEDIGSGNAEVSATKDGRVTGKSQTTWVCGECHCSAEPDRLTLTLSP